MSAARRLKRAVRGAIHDGGGIENAAADTGKSTTTVGRWHSRSEPDLPTLGDAFAIDEAALIEGRPARILQRLAAELDHVAIRLPACEAGEDAETGALAAATAEFGDVARKLMDCRADGQLDADEREDIGREIDQAIAALARMKAVVLPDSVRSVPVRQVN